MTEPANWGISAGYISKQWNTQSGDSNLKENIWGDPNKWIYGVRAGFHVSPGFWWGLGLHTGLYYEFYTSSNDHIRKQGGMYNFQEHALYIPLHTYYRFPLSKDYCILTPANGVADIINHLNCLDFSKYKTCYLLLDNDTAGDDATEQILEEYSFFIDKRGFLKKNNIEDVADYWRFKYGSN